MINNQRGIALIITLLVVVLLTITVIEFTYSVQVDQHMAHNALSGLQASLLARSGINLGEAFLLHDKDQAVDAFTEDWCLDPSPDGHSCRIDETNGQVLLPQNMRLRVQIIDEGGKLDLNWLVPHSPQEWKRWQADKNNRPKDLLARKQALERLLSSRGVNPTIAEQLFEYWEERLFPNLSSSGPVGGASQTPPPLGTPTPDPGTQLAQQGFASLDDASVVPGLTPTVIRRLRQFITALPKPQKVNINTAPADVLQAIYDDEGTVSDIIAQRSQAPMKTLPPPPPANPQAIGMLSTKSVYFLVRASGVVNPNPVTGRGGIGRSATMLVERQPHPPQPGRASVVPWSLKQLDWQKEGGAVLFQPQGDQEPGTEDQQAVSRSSK